MSGVGLAVKVHKAMEGKSSGAHPMISQVSLLFPDYCLLLFFAGFDPLIVWARPRKALRASGQTSKRTRTKRSSVRHHTPVVASLGACQTSIGALLRERSEARAKGDEVELCTNFLRFCLLSYLYHFIPFSLLFPAFSLPFHLVSVSCIELLLHIRR